MDHLLCHAIHFIRFQRAFCNIGFTLGHSVVHIGIRECILQHLDKCFQNSRAAFVQICFKHLDNRELTIDLILEPATIINWIPDMDEIIRLYISAAVFVYTLTAAYCVFNNIYQILFDKMRQGSLRLFDVNFPNMIQRVRNIHSYPCQFPQFIMLNQPEPGSPNNQTLVSVYVESLLLTQFLFTANSRNILLGQLADIGQHIRFHTDLVRCNSQHLLTQRLCCGVFCQERINAFYRFTIEIHRQPVLRIFIVQKAMEYKRYVFSGQLDFFIKSLLHFGCSLLQAIKFLPNNNCAGFLQFQI